MEVKSESLPGSVRRIRGTQYAQEFVMLSKDKDLLTSIPNASDGSMALCVDTGEMYIKHDDTWYLMK